MKHSTGLVIVSPKSVGPWRDAVWRTAFTIDLVEGSGSGPAWYTCNNGPRQDGEWYAVRSEASAALADTLIVLVSALAGDADAVGLWDMERAWAEKHHDSKRMELPKEKIATFSTALESKFRFGLVEFAADSALAKELSVELAKRGFTVDIFVNASRAAI